MLTAASTPSAMPSGSSSHCIAEDQPDAERPAPTASRTTPDHQRQRAACPRGAGSGTPARSACAAPCDAARFSAGFLLRCLARAWALSACARIRARPTACTPVGAPSSSGRAASAPPGAAAPSSARCARPAGRAPRRGRAPSARRAAPPGTTSAPAGPAITPGEARSPRRPSRVLDELLGLDPALDRVVARRRAQVLGDRDDLAARVVQVVQRGGDLVGGLAHAQDQVATW